jgi:hypothetical protein
MAKKRTKAKPKAKRPKKKRPNLTQQWLRILGAIAVLVLIVVSAGMLVHLFLRPPAPTNTARQVKTPQNLPPSIRKPTKPTFEVFPKKEAPPAPLGKLETLPGDQPPLVAIIIDDIGYDRHLVTRFLNLHVPLTLSLLPYSPFGRQIANDAQGNGYEIMLHLPMEPNEYPRVDPGPGALFGSMSADELIGELNSDLDQIPGVSGVNNHMGSRLTTSPEHMRQIFSILKKRRLFYVDSRTSAETVARLSAEMLQVPFAERDIFIDHVDDPNFIRAQLGRLIKRARRQGYAIGIGHPHENTYQVLKEMLPKLRKEAQLVPASMVVQRAQTLSASKKNSPRK